MSVQNQEYNYQVVDGILSDREADWVEQLILGDQENRHIIPQLRFIPKYEPTADQEDGTASLSFYYPIKDDINGSSKHIETFLGPIINWCGKNSVPLQTLINARVFITYPSDNKDLKHHVSHIDLPHIDAHLSAIYYVHDADGPTYLFRNDGTILDKVYPKKNRLLVFYGKIQHGAGVPKTGHRCIVNYNFIA